MERGNNLLVSFRDPRTATALKLKKTIEERGLIPDEERVSIPDDVSFEIIESTVLSPYKRSLVLRLNKKVSEETLRTIALKLKGEDPQRYERTFIGYILPGMALGSGFWATTHFNPTLEVLILGATAAEEQKLKVIPEPGDREIVGYWFDEMVLGHRVTIFRKGGKLFIERTFKDGTNHTAKLLEKKTPLGRRFDEVERSSSGDHWILDSEGNLQSHDNDGLVNVAKKIQ